MAKQFEVRDAAGNVLFKAPKNVRVIEVSVGSNRGELARVGVQDDTYLTLGFITTGRLVPNLLDVEEAQREARNEFAKANSPDAPDEDDEEAQAREGTPGSFDYVLTQDQPNFESSELHKEKVGTAAGDSPTETGGTSDPDSETPEFTSDEQTTPNPGQPSDPSKVSEGTDPDKGNSSNNPGGLNL